MKRLIIAITLQIFLLVNCSTTEPNESALELKVEDVSSTEVWLRVSKVNSSQSTNVTVKRDGEEIYNFILTKNDTVLKDTKLLPDKSYSYQATNLSSGQTVTTTAATMDTTNHQINWEEYTFGGGAFSGSYFNDVAIIDENNIWAVGAVYMKDSLGNDDPTPWNAVHWNGETWDLFRIQFYTFCEQNHTSSYPARAVYVLEDKTILIGSDGSKLAYVKEEQQIRTECVPVSILKIWGTTRENLYIVGRGTEGNIAHFNGNSWQILESGTEIRLTDIYGTPDGETIWVCGWDYDHPGTALLEIKNQKVRHIWDGLSNLGEYVLALNSVWAARTEFWTAGAFVFRQSVLFSDVGRLVRYQSGKLFEPGNGVLSLRGTDNNNVYIAGDLGMLWHFNGSSWHKYEELYNADFDRRINGMAVKDNLVVAVGWKNSDAWIAVGKK